MPRSCDRSSPRVEDQPGSAWPTYEAMFEDALAAGNAALGRDGEQLAVDCGLSRRELNKQRERGDVDPDLGGPAALGHQWLFRAALWLDAVHRRYGADRCRPAARVIARACGAALAADVPATAKEPDSVVIGVASVMREVGEACALAAAAAVDGIDAREAKALLPQIDEALEELRGLRNAVEHRTVATLTFGHQA